MTTFNVVLILSAILLLGLVVGAVFGILYYRYRINKHVNDVMGLMPIYAEDRHLDHVVHSSDNDQTCLHIPPPPPQPPKAPPLRIVKDGELPKRKK